ncbi:hypothetical protein ABEB36_011623 [Hypothenemus hampei]|uniref:Uncharacterized protein n=1 Tax=Hypothenemus hampei TaxID=57062 RepID=A0ABD1E8Q4_HYPHA
MVLQVVVEINKVDQQSPNESNQEPCRRPLSLHLEHQVETESKSHRPSQTQNLDEILTVGKSDSVVENLPTLLKQNGARLVECSQKGDSNDRSGVFFNFSRAFCCLRTRRSS